MREMIQFKRPDEKTALWRPRIGGLSDEVLEVAYLDSGVRLMHICKECDIQHLCEAEGTLQ
jgi:hypothetical protein